MANRSATGSFRLTCTGTIVNTLDDNGTAQHQEGNSALVDKNLTNGVSADQMSRAWEDTRTISSGTEDLDLYDLAGVDIGAGTGNDALGQAIIHEEIVAIVIVQTAGPGRLEIMPSNPTNAVAWMPALTVANGGALRTGACLAMFNPDTDAFPITDASSNEIRLGANGGAVTYRITILARHDDDESSSPSSSSSSSSSTSSTSSRSSSSSSSVSSSSSSSVSSSQTMSTSSSSLTNSTSSSSASP